MKKITFDMKDKVAVVVGGPTGIGNAIAMEYAGWGANVIAFNHLPDQCEAAAKAIEAEGVRSMAVSADATDKAQVEALCDKIVAEFGRIDILVNAAGINRRHDVEEFPIEEYDAVMNINTRSVFICCQVFGKQMIKQGYGKIINISSMGAFFGLNRVVPYCASKGAVMQMTKGFAVEWGKHNIQCNCIAPGYFKTELTQGLHQDAEREAAVLNRNPMKRWGNVDELRGAAVFLATDASSFVTGSTVVVDGGMMALGV